ncbi:unnamed protein product [Enterobius vermicularis]|uniref:Na_H_Exchanger domain-containing protein n=1 Tax=Enterobius vermicularis TaxID=51028 RepID=A0A0N4VA05_ENTVE|nr:unnamed protein product [Enterobius vermicularis]
MMLGVVIASRFSIGHLESRYSFAMGGSADVAGTAAIVVLYLRRGREMGRLGRRRRGRGLFAGGLRLLELLYPEVG